MTVLWMIVIVRTIEISGHHADIISAILTVEELAVFQPANLSEGIGLVGLLQLACQQAALWHWLGSHARVDT